MPSPTKHRRPKPRKQPRAKGRRNSRALIRVTPRDRRAGKRFENLVALQARLRAPGGCPWDREQTHESLRKFLIEETYEVLDAMDSADARKFSSELGDLLLQVVFHSILAEEEGRFTISDVIESIHTKMVRRHPHVFGAAKADTSAAVLKHWERIKAAERAADAGETVRDGSSASGASILDGIPHSLPAILEAYQLTRRASHIGFDWENIGGIFEKLQEEERELREALPSPSPKLATVSPAPRIEEETGDLLFAAVNVAHFLGVDPEIALKKANRKFKSRFQWMEAAALREGRTLAEVPRSRMEELWNLSKSRQTKLAAANTE